MEIEQMSSLIQTFFNDDFQTIKLEDPAVDYTLRCNKGIYNGYFIYMNLTQVGEIIGSKSDGDITLKIDDANIAPRHVSIMARFDEETNRINYILRDLKSGQPSWIKIRTDMPVVVKHNMEIKIGKLIYKLILSDQPVKEAQEWLQLNEMSHLETVFEENKIKLLSEVRDLKQEQIRKLFLHYNLDDSKLDQFLQCHGQINIQFPSGYCKNKLQVVLLSNGEQIIQVGWCGATISSKTYVYQKPPEKLILKDEFDDFEENPYFELIISYLYGKYVIQTWKNDNYDIFYKISEWHSLIPDDSLKIGNLQLTVQRFNTGFWLDQGSQSYMEDAISIIHDIGVSHRVSVSCYGVFDGHNGDECVKYISANLFDNLKEMILKSNPPFDQQPQFYTFMADVIKKTFINTDEEFYQDFIEDKAIWTGSVCAIVIIAGSHLISANLGDCRAVLCREGVAVDLSQDHKPNVPSEKERIERKGGNVSSGRLGKLSVSRSFGDFGYKKQREKSCKNLLSVKPEIRAHKIDYQRDEFIVLFSDGVIEAFQTNQTLVDFIRERLLENKLMEQDPQQISKEVLQYTYETVMKQRNRTDNLSIIIVNLTRGISQVNK